MATSLPRWPQPMQGRRNDDRLARIFWGKYEPASTQVIYGPTTSYGSSSPLDPTMVTAHAVNLTGLAPGTTYHFRTRSIDAAGNIGSMHDLTFTTAK
jgi:hypothetical protein